MSVPPPVTSREADRGLSRRFSGVLPNRVLVYRSPRFWQEIVLIAVSYWLYSKVRNAVPDQEQLAIRHGRSVEKLQDWLRLGFERSVNTFVARHEWLAQFMDYYYATLHFAVTIGVMVWLFRYRPRMYRGARTVLFLTTLLGLVGFYFYPLAPPRLMPGLGYIDTLDKFHTWGSLADPKVAAHSNQYAAMPSLHIGWALWCGISLFFCARRLWVRILGLLYPVFTLMVIVGTANHYVIDAVGGLVVFVVGALIQLLLSGHSAFTPAPDVYPLGGTNRPPKSAENRPPKDSESQPT